MKLGFSLFSPIGSFSLLASYILVRGSINGNQIKYVAAKFEGSFVFGKEKR